MANFVDAMTGFMRDNFCAALGVLGDAVTLGSRITPVGPDFINLPNALGALVCDKPPDSLAPPAPPFTGGQCQGVTYNIRFSFTNDQGQRIEIDQQITQALVGTYTQPGNFGSKQVGYETRSPIGTITRTNQATVQDPNTNPAPSVVVLNRQDGLPDNCGNPPAPYPAPGNTYNFGGDVTYEGDDGLDITVPTTVVFAPIYNDIDGSLRIPVTVNVDGLEFTGNLEVSPSFTLNLRPKGITSGPGEPDDPELGPGQPGVPVPEDEEDVEAIIGVLVFSTLESNENKATGYPAVGGPTFLVPRIGSVQFAIKTGNSIGWTSDIDVKNLECYVPCPCPQGAIAVRVTPEAGITRTFTPVRGKPLTSF